MQANKSFILKFTHTLYILVLIILVGWETFAYLLAKKLIQELEPYEKLISLNTQQSILSQKIALNVYNYTAKPSADKKLQLEALVSQLKTNNQFMSKSLSSKQIKDLLRQEGSFQIELIVYFKLLENYLNDPTLKKANQLSLQSEQFLINLNTVLKILTDEHQSLLQEVHEQAKFSYIEVMALLLFITLIMLRPIAKKTQKYIQNLENENKKYRHDILLYSTIFDNTQEGILLTDSKERIIKVNNSFSKITGYSAEESIGKTPKILQSSVNKKDFYAQMWDEINTKGIWSGKIVNKNFQGKNYAEFLTILKIHNEENDIYNFVSIFSDFSNLHETLGKFQKLIDLQNNIILISDNSKILFANKRFFEFSGFENLESFLEEHTCVCNLFIANDHFFHLGKVSDPNTWIYALSNIPEEKRIISMTNKENEQKSFKVMIDKYEDDTNIIVFTDISKNLMDKDILRDKAEKDKLTGCYNREYLHGIFDNFVEKRLAQSKQTGIILFDIDNFKSINDTYGHNRGDEVLKTLSKLLHSNTREDDILIRWGGEEFIILFSSNSFLEALRLAEKFRSLIESEYFEEIEHLTCSFGLTLYRSKELLETTIERADKALYKAKANGKNRVEIVEDIL